MESNPKRPMPADDPELDLYAIPLSTSWFSWDSIHDTERVELREFFDSSSYTRSPKIYKEYRDFIISKYREDPSRRLTFTEVRKSLVGDVSLLRKVFNFLEKWGLINFSSPPSPADEAVGGDVGGWKVKVEDGPPVGVKVVAAPNSLKPLVAPPPPAPCRDGGVGLVGGGDGFKMPPLASYSDIFGDLGKGEGFVCGSCKERSVSMHYECTKDNDIICTKCFEIGTYGESKSADDYKLKDLVENGNDQRAPWTETETLLLLESVLKHGDDWELVAQNVQTRTKLECISRLIELPFGELMLGSHSKISSKGILDVVNDVEEVKSAPNEPQETKGTADAHSGQIIRSEENGGTESHSPCPKKRRVDSSNCDKPLMEQVALISVMAGPQVQSAALSGAVSALCDGNPLLAHIFYSEDDSSADELIPGNLNAKLEREIQLTEDSETDQIPRPSGVDDETFPSKDSIPLPLRMRTAVATALGAAAVHARVLANLEEREIEHLVATVIETQLKKMRSKIKHLEHLESIMEEEYAQLVELKESIIAERMDVLRKIFSSGISRWRDHVPMKPQPSNV